MCLFGSTALEIVLSGACDDQLHVMVADVMKSFDTVDRSILGRALGRLGLRGLSWLLAWVSLGVGMGAYLKDAR